MNTTRRFASMLVLLATIPFWSGCSGDAGGDTPDLTAGNSQSENDLSARSLTPGGDDWPKLISASQILITYKGADLAPSSVTRSKQEARQLAEEVAEMAQQEGADFAALAKKYSDHFSASAGGYLGSFSPHRMERPFGEAAVKLEEGEVSDPVETISGFYIIRRQPVPAVKQASARHILVMYKGSRLSPETVTRTKEEALARAQDLLERARQGEDFAELAREYSDGPSNVRGGDLGEFGEGVMMPAFEKAVFESEVGEIPDIVQTPFGYHVIYRYK